MTKREAALAYTTLGWNVFPLYSIEKGRCTCGKESCTNPGKHPATMHGLLDATNEPAQVAMWWGETPDANIGVRTGEESGMVVMDIDDMTKRDLYDIPKTVHQRTGSGGEHHLFVYPNRHVKTRTKVFSGVDSRGDGGYIVAPPSTHVMGIYEWVESPFDGCDFADVPDWWIQAVDTPAKMERVVNDGGKIEKGSRHNDVFAFGVRTWKATPVPETVFSATLHAYNREMCAEPLPDDEVDAMVKSITQYDGMTEDEWRKEKEFSEMIYNFAANAKKSRQEEIAMMLAEKSTKVAGPMPEFMPRSGLIREIAEYILSQSERPIPILAVCAATALVGALAGRKFESPSQLGPNLLLVGLAESGSGKEKSRKLLGKIANDVGASGLIGADDIASAPGLIAELNENPVKLFMLDEFGLFLSSVTDKNSSSTKRDIMSVIMRMYSAYGGTYYGTAYADQTKRKKVVIDNPCMVLYATSVHQNFYEALSLEHGSDGFISRLLVVPAGEARPDLRRPVYGPMPGHLKARLVEFAGFSAPAIITVPMTAQVDQAFFDLDESMTELMVTPQTRSVYARVKENAIKLALVHAISMNFTDPGIGHESFEWGRDIALWCANHITEKLETAVGNSEDDKKYNRAVEIILASGPTGVSKRELLRKYKGMKSYDRDDLLRSIYDLGDAFEHDGRIVHMKFYKIVKG